MSLVAAAMAATQAWLDRHFLPSFVVAAPSCVRIETAVRIVVAAAGVALAVIARRRFARAIVERRAEVVQIAIAVVLALLAAQAALRFVSLRPGEWLIPGEEPRRQPDAVLGWTLVPSRAGQLAIGGRTVEYAVNRLGSRARSIADTPDPAKPTMIFAGESIVFGEGLTFDESIPTETGAMLGVQTANLGVNGYSSDQAFLRLRRELPRFQHPTAVVSIFMPILFGRNLDDDRPRLGPGLMWMPAARHARLLSLARLFVPYRSEDQIAQGIALTRDVLRATADLARARGAWPLLVVPHVGPEDPADLHRVDQARAVLTVPLGGDWTIGMSDRLRRPRRRCPLGSHRGYLRVIAGLPSAPRTCASECSGSRAGRLPRAWPFRSSSRCRSASDRRWRPPRTASPSSGRCRISSR